jgi:YVTN family beta-propeller protein
MTTLHAHAVLIAGAFAALVWQGNAPRGTLVVSNMNDHTATILDAATGRVRATVPTGEGPHEVTISHDGKWALVSNYGVRGKPGSSLTVIDVAKAEVARTISLGELQRPHGMAFFPGDTTFVVTSEAKQSVAIVDFRDGHVITTIPTKGRASHMVGMPSRADFLVTANIADNTISLLDPAARDSTKLLAVARAPEGIAVAPNGSAIWAGSNRDSVIVVVDTRRVAVVDTLRGFGMPYRIAFTPDSRTVVVSDPVKGEIRVFDATNRKEKFTIAVPRDSLVSTAEVPGSPSPEGVTVSSDNKWAFVTLQGRNRVATIDLSRGTIVRLAPTGVWSDGIGYSTVVGK